MLLATKSSSPQTVFAVIFAIVSVGAVALTLNVLLLVCPLPMRRRLALTHQLLSQGGRIIFFQSVAVLGYCLFPLDVRARRCQRELD